jgi:hypothetical protein
VRSSRTRGTTRLNLLHAEVLSTEETTRIQLAYPESPELFAGEDPRSDSRILQALSRSGKLRQGSRNEMALDTMRTVAGLLSLVFVLASVLSAPGCSGPSGDEPTADDGVPSADQGTQVVPFDNPQMPSRGYYKGFASILPPDGDLGAAYQRASENAEFAGIWVGAPDSGYWNLAEDLSGWWGDQFVEGLVRDNGMFPIINLSFIDRDTDSGSLILKVPESASFDSLSDPDFRDAYKRAAIDAVKASSPRYLSLGNEVNRWYEQYGSAADNPNGFQHFVSLYEEIYDAVKELSPQTVVFCVFSREIVDEHREANLDVLDMFDPGKLDMLAFTSYPFAVNGIGRVSDIPDDYYSRALDHLGDRDKPIGFTEVTWSTLDAFGGEAAQADFVTDMAGRLTIGQGIDLDLLGWWTLVDLEGDPHGTGLITRDGRARVAYAIWKDL